MRLPLTTYPIVGALFFNMANVSPFGYISLHREISQHWIYPNHRKLTQFEAWIDLLMMANFSERKTKIGNKIVTIEAGQILCSQQNLAMRWLWGHKEARNFLQTLQSDSMINLKTQNKWTVLTICNWDTYQLSGQTKGKQRANTGQHYNKEYNKEEDKDMYALFIQKFNEVLGSKYTASNKKFRSNLDQLLKNGYKGNDAIQALRNAMKDPYHVETGYKYISPEFITRIDKLEKFLNYKPEKEKAQNKINVPNPYLDGIAQ